MPRRSRNHLSESGTYHVMIRGMKERSCEEYIKRFFEIASYRQASS